MLPNQETLDRFLTNTAINYAETHPFCKCYFAIHYRSLWRINTNICEAICVSAIYHSAAGTDLARISQLSSLKSTITSNRLSFNENESTLLQDELIRTLDLPSFFKWLYLYS